LGIHQNIFYNSIINSFNRNDTFLQMHVAEYAQGLLFVENLPEKDE